MKQVIVLAVLVLACLLSRQALAQGVVPFKSKDKDTIRTVFVWHSDTLREVKKDSVSIQSLFGHVKLQQGKTLFYCDSVAINQTGNIIEAFRNVHINDSDTTDIYSQYMKYYVDKKQITFQKDVTLSDGKGVLTTAELQYDLNQRIGNYYNGGRVVNGPTVITSRDGTYFAQSKDVYFKRDVVLKDPAYDLKADSLLYNTETQLATFIAKTFIRDSSGRTISTTEGFYDLKGHKATFAKRPVMTDGSQSIVGDSVRFDDSTGNSIATGHAVFQDTSQGLTVLAELMVGDKKKGTVLATQHPVLILKQESESDSIYIAADTFYSGRIPDSLMVKKDSLGNPIPDSAGKQTDTSARFIQGFHHVRVYSDSLQALADSLYYSGADSIFRLFTNPVAWASGRQVTGDTMYLYTKNKKPDRLYVFENGLVTAKSGDNMFDQIKGNTLNGYFKDGVIDYMRAKGSAESIYYIKDDSMALVGVNKVSRADIIDMIFVDKALNKVVLRNDANGTMYPIRKVNLDDMRLRNFKWLDDKRPKSKYELLEINSSIETLDAGGKLNPAKKEY
jgi:lipopolysaccharide export system protein LptA